MIQRAVHGGDIRGLARSAARPVTDFIDFSANINPLGPPPGVRTLVRDYAGTDWLMHYPEPGLPELAAILAHARNVAPRNIVIHAGSAALFDVLLRACAPRRLGLCVPAFAEYARAAAANGITLSRFQLDAANARPFDSAAFCRWAQLAALDAVILTNPHNPLGFGLPAATVRALRAALPQTTFIIDEAFADYDERLSVAADAADDERLIVVRSVTKFYAMPDFRVGYAVMSEARAQAVAGYLPAWPVSGIAAAAAAVALTAESYADHARARNALCRAQLAAGLTALQRRVLPAAANFIAFESPGATALAERLLRKHAIIVRDCSSFAGLPPDRYIRVAVRELDENAGLLAALASTIE